MAGKVSISNRQKGVAVDPGEFKRAAKKILTLLGYEDYEVSIVLVDDREITRLNRQYFHRNRPTNVISFPMLSDGLSPTHPKILGDVVISADTAHRDAKAVGKKAAEEIFFLLIHGILHLIGFDHEGSREERKKMETKEKELFAFLMRPASRKSSGR